MIAMAVISVLLGIVVAVRRAIEREFPSTPAAWAWMQGATYRTQSIQYRDLALAFERSGEAWGEGTYIGPFTDELARGQSVIIREGARAEPADRKGKTLGKGVRWPIASGTTGTVMTDRVIDQDACYEFRGVLVQFAAGPHRGEIGLVERIYLRRRR
jgi:hypothetical protein